ncbi:MAG: CHAT domain-containing protein [Gemmatimonadales bacterium]|nr:CHAT domain-containing protein [Gemmatimonadales bacterium]
MALVGCAPDAPELASIDHLLEGHRPLELLVAPGSASLPCLARRAGIDDSLSRLACLGTEGPARLHRAAARMAPSVRAALAGDPGASALRAAGLLDLIAGGDDRIAIRRAVARLDEAVSLDSANPRMLRDAATAHAVAAGVEQDAGHLFQALDLIERAVERDSLDETIRFNRALLLEHANLVGEAAAAWEVAQPPGMGHLRERIESDSTRAAFARLPRGGPEGVREHALEVLLPAWGAHALAGRSDSAATALTLARHAGQALDALGGDSVIRSAIHLIDSSAGGARLAEGFVAYGAGRARFIRGEFEAAKAHLRRAHSLLGYGGAGAVSLWGWPLLYVAAVEIYEGRIDAAHARYLEIRTAAELGGYPSLYGRAVWGAALALSRQDRPERAIPLYLDAIAHFQRARERTNVAAMESQLADMYALTGDVTRASNAFLRAGRAFRVRRDLGTLHGFLLGLASFETRSGRPYSAAAILREDRRVAARTGSAKDLPEALTRLAAAEFDLGRRARARAVLDTAAALLSTIESDLMRTRIGIEVRQVDARLTGGQEAVDRLTDVTTYFDRTGLPFRLAPALVERADARLTTRDTLGAERDLDRAVSVVRRRAAELDPLASQATREIERKVFQRRIAIRLARGDSTGALAEIDRLRSWGQRAEENPAALARRLGSGAGVLVYAVLPDRLIRWTVVQGRIETAVLPVTERELAAQVVRFVALLRQGGDSSRLATLNDELYNILLGGADAPLRTLSRLAIVSDPAISSVPFAALRRPRHGHFLIQDLTLHHSFGVLEAVDGLMLPALQATEHVLLVGDPAGDGAAELAPLRHTAPELRLIAGLYRHATVVTGPEATPANVRQALGTATLFHFSGHAQSAAFGTRASRLLLTEQFTGPEIAALRLPRLRLVILAACETLAQPGRRSYRADGLAESFLAAGVGGVIGSGWQVDDEVTALLMTTLHVELRRGRPPAEALRAAQVALIEEGGTAGMGLKTWAAFRYITR